MHLHPVPGHPACCLLLSWRCGWESPAAAELVGLLRDPPEVHQRVLLHPVLPQGGLISAQLQRCQRVLERWSAALLQQLPGRPHLHCPHGGCCASAAQSPWAQMLRWVQLLRLLQDRPPAAEQQPPRPWCQRLGPVEPCYLLLRVRWDCPAAAEPALLQMGPPGASVTGLASVRLQMVQKSGQSQRCLKGAEHRSAAQLQPLPGQPHRDSLLLRLHSTELGVIAGHLNKHFHAAQ